MESIYIFLLILIISLCILILIKNKEHFYTSPLSLTIKDPQCIPQECIPQNCIPPNSQELLDLMHKYNKINTNIQNLIEQEEVLQKKISTSQSNYDNIQTAITTASTNAANLQIGNRAINASCITVQEQLQSQIVTLNKNLNNCFNQVYSIQQENIDSQMNSQLRCQEKLNLQTQTLMPINQSATAAVIPSTVNLVK